MPSPSATSTAWTSRPTRQAMSSEELADWVDEAADRSERMLFTITPREELDELGRWQRLQDQSWVGKMRAIVAAGNRLGELAEFASDEIALALNISPITASKLRTLAVSLASLPGLLEAVAAGMFSSVHAIAVVRELDKVQLTEEQRACVVLVALARYQGQTPGELGRLVARLVLEVDLDAARQRQDRATDERFVSTYRDVDGQAVIHARGPIAQAAAVEAALDRWMRDNPRDPDDERTESQRRYDAFISLLTGGGAQAGSWQAAIVVPFSTATGGDLELAEIPGLGPVLPSTARELMELSDTLRQIAVDAEGDVITAGAPTPAPSQGGLGAALPTRAVPAPREPLDGGRAGALRLLMSTPPPERLRAENLGSAAYRTPDRIRRYLLARDRHCVFPGCHVRVTDVDHRIPWPLGPTNPWNLQLLCRRHHRAKQAVFSVRLTPDGDYLWTTRGGWQFTRHRQGF